MSVFSTDRRMHLENTTKITSYLTGFYTRHRKLSKYKPSVKVKTTSGGSSHGEARQHGREIWIFPKFWDLDQDLKDFVFAHELGHYVKSLSPPTKLMHVAEKVGVDVWDSSALPFGQFNQEEAFADCFASYFLKPGELKKRYPKWLEIVEIMIGAKNERKMSVEDNLTSWAIKAMITSPEKDATKRAEWAAITTGKHAKRLGLTSHDVSRWLQTAYGKVWVKEGGLNPGLDLKDLRKIILKAMR